jgi:hypothetical protein
MSVTECNGAGCHKSSLILQNVQFQEPLVRAENAEAPGVSHLVVTCGQEWGKKIQTPNKSPK